LRKFKEDFRDFTEKKKQHISRIFEDASLELHQHFQQEVLWGKKEGYK
jgi:hypothetical protein